MRATWAVWKVVKLFPVSPQAVAVDGYATAGIGKRVTEGVSRSEGSAWRAAPQRKIPGYQGGLACRTVHGHDPASQRN